MTKICDIPYPIYDQTIKKTLFQLRIISSLVLNNVKLPQTDMSYEELLLIFLLMMMVSS